MRSASFVPHVSAGNNFYLFRGHMSFQIFLLVGHLTNWTGHILLTDNTLKKRTQDVLVTCSAIVSDHNVKLAGHFQNLFGQCQMTDYYFQHCIWTMWVLALLMELGPHKDREKLWPGWELNQKVVGSIPTLVTVFLCPCVGPIPLVGQTLTWFIHVWGTKLALLITL